MELPKTYNFKEKEKYWKKYWEENGIYRFDENSNKPIYSIDTPPPYVSAEHLHVGHIMSYSQAEFIARFKRMRGFNVFYPMGFDDNGLPTERFVEKKYNIDKSKIKKRDFIKLCLRETKIGSKNYRELWTKLGISVDWTKTYSTINKLCQRISQWSFIDLYKKGKVYRREEPMLWCPKCQTALAQADLEDKKEDALLYYIRFNINNEDYPIATTRPELIPACVALFANPKDSRYKHLREKKAKVPIFNFHVPILFSEDVNPNYGTGLMMVCTWGDIEDVEKIRRAKLTPRQAVDRKGNLTDLAGKYEGLNIYTARKAIVKDLKKENLLIKEEKISHIVNTHERCDTPIEFILTKQWFIDVLSIKKELLKRGRELNWYPKHMENMYRNWVLGLKWDWCISRQRYYGVPFPVWYHKKTGEVLLAREEDLPQDPTVDEPPVPKREQENYIPDTDVMDTWATSSCTPFIIPELIKDENLKKKIFPNSLRPQAFEIIRTWLFYSIVKAHYHFNKLPFKDAMLSGHGLDEKGRKISKRLGNYTNPNILIDQYGADAIRYWATGAKLGSSHRFDPKEVRKGKYTVNKIWNASRFCYMQFRDFDISEISKVVPDLEDKWILHKLNNAIKEVTAAFENYEYADARAKLDKFFWGTFCDYYLEIIKHRADQISVKYTLFICLLNSLKLYAPILPFVTEELYQHIFKDYENKKSIHKTKWPKPNKDWEMKGDELKEVELFIEEINNVRKEKSKKGLNFKDRLEGYTPKTKVDLSIFGEKLEKMLNVIITSRKH